MGRSLTNTMVNTGIETEFEEAVYEVSVCLFYKGAWGVLLAVFNMQTYVI